jgi:hypothetical protein
MQSAYKDVVAHLDFGTLSQRGFLEIYSFSKLRPVHVVSSGRGIGWSSSISDTTSSSAYDLTVHSRISHFENLSALALTKCTRPSASVLSIMAIQPEYTGSLDIVANINHPFGELNGAKNPRLTKPPIIAVKSFVRRMH